MRKSLKKIAFFICSFFFFLFEAANNCTYAFASTYVFQICVENNLHQRSAFRINELFPKGPQRVTAAVTNMQNGVTTLLNGRLVYRYKWTRKNRPFCVSC